MPKKPTTTKGKKPKKSAPEGLSKKTSAYQQERDIFDDHGPVIIGSRTDKPKL